MRQTKIGEWPAMSVSAAIAEWERLRSSRGAGVDLAADKQIARAAERTAARAELERKRAETLTVARLCEHYVVDRVEKNRKEKSVKEVRRIFGCMLAELADVPAASVTRQQAYDLISSHAETPVVAAHLRGELGGAWDYGFDSGKLPDTAPNWWRLILRGQLRSKGRYIQGALTGAKKRVLNEDEIGTLIRWLPNFSRLVEEVCTLYMWTALRGAEILAIEKHEISDEVDGLWWTVPKEKTKNHWRENAADLRVPLIGRAEQIIRRRIEAASGSFLFPSNGALAWTQQKTVGCQVWLHMPYSQTRPAYERPRLPVTNWAPHDLRRTARTQLASLGCPDEVAEAVIGHMPSGIKGVYNRYAYDKERREWLTKLSDRFEELAAGR